MSTLTAKGGNLIGKLFTKLATAIIFLIQFIVGLILGAMLPKDKIYYFAKDNLAGNAVSDAFAYISLIFDPIELGKVTMCALRAVVDLIQVKREANKSEKEANAADLRLRGACIDKLRAIAIQRGFAAKDANFDELMGMVIATTENETAKERNTRERALKILDVKAAKDEMPSGKLAEASDIDPAFVDKSQQKKHAADTATAKTVTEVKVPSRTAPKPTPVNPNIKKADAKISEYKQKVEATLQREKKFNEKTANVNASTSKETVDAKFIEKVLKEMADNQSMLAQHVQNVSTVLADSANINMQSNAALVDAVKQTVPIQTPQSILNRRQLP